jgi:hypothetical protein
MGSGSNASNLLRKTKSTESEDTCPLKRHLQNKRATLKSQVKIKKNKLGARLQFDKWAHLWDVHSASSNPKGIGASNNPKGIGSAFGSGADKYLASQSAGQRKRSNRSRTARATSTLMALREIFTK